jgi:hypothetical protein
VALAVYRLYLLVALVVRELLIVEVVVVLEV